MPLTAYTTLLDDVMPELPGCPTALATHHLKRAAREFYERSLISQEELAPIDVVAGTSDYTIAPYDFANYDLIKVMLVTLAGPYPKPFEIFPRTPQQLNRDLPGWNTEQGRVEYYTQPSYDVIRLVSIPDTDYLDGLRVTIARAPSASGEGMEDVVARRYGEAIAAGAKARIMRMPNRPWSDPRQAVEYQNQFNYEVAGAGALVAKAFGRGPLRTVAVP